MKKKSILLILAIVFVTGCQSSMSRLTADEIQNDINSGKNLDAIDEDGNTRLTWEAMFHHNENIKLLLKHGADVNAKDSDGETALFKAVMLTKESKKVLETIKILVNHGANVNVKNSDGDNVLASVCLASEKKDILEIVKYFMDKGVDIKAKNSRGFSAWDGCEENKAVYNYVTNMSSK